jgi:hypothetical protein
LQRKRSERFDPQLSPWFAESSSERRVVTGSI